MSKVVARYFQKCDMCDQEFQLQCEKAELGKAVLPGWFIPIAEYLRDKYILNDVEYGGIQIDKMPPKEEA